MDCSFGEKHLNSQKHFLKAHFICFENENFFVEKLTLLCWSLIFKWCFTTKSLSVSISCILPNLIFISKSKHLKFMCPIKFLWVSKCFARAFFEPILHHHCYYTSHYLQRWSEQHLSHGANMEDVLFFSVLPTLRFVKIVVFEGTFWLGNIGTLKKILQGCQHFPTQVWKSRKTKT